MQKSCFYILFWLLITKGNFKNQYLREKQFLIAYILTQTFYSSYVPVHKVKDVIVNLSSILKAKIDVLEEYQTLIRLVVEN